ncbi:hypothetical protein [Bradyrhizobium sp. McL0616]|uniref:hypothetical protein n=1 Tax=Bradyrhizobium sp. McL0616 TaxID=3415674 RepID=UPI003CF67278
MSIPDVNFPDLTPIIYLLYGIMGLFLVGMCAIIFYMRKRHPHEVYAIWLVASFFFTILLGANIVAHKNNIGLLEVCGSYEEHCKQLYAIMTSTGDELKLIGVFVAITVTPQVLAYFLSALSGSATAPRYVRTIQQAAAWSLIKFVAAIGGGMAGLILSNWIAGQKTDPDDFIWGPMLMAVAFLLAFFNLAFWDFWGFLAKKYSMERGLISFPIRALIAVHKWATRNVPKPRPYELPRAALIELLKSDAVYNFITQNKENT